MPTATVLALLLSAAPAQAVPEAKAAKPEPIKLELTLTPSPIAKGQSKAAMMKGTRDMTVSRAPAPSPLVATKGADGKLRLEHGPRPDVKTKAAKAGADNE